MVFEEINKKDWEAIATYLSGEMNQQEAVDFEKRVAASKENEAYFKQVKTDWEIMENLKQKNTFDTNKAWGNLYNKMEQDGLLDTKSSINKFKLSRLAEIAAIFVVGILLTTLLYYIVSDTTKKNWQVADTYESPEIRTIKLSDGSVVYLNAESKLYFPEAFEGDVRIVEFEGDGFFEISKNPNKPFIIKAKNAEIRVLGTSFNVNTKAGNDRVEVLVETGKVQLTATKNKSIHKVLEPGFIGTLDNNNIKKEINTDINYMAWKTRTFNFEGVPLKKAVEALNRAYNVNIVCNDDRINNIKLVSPFQNKPLDTVIQVLCELEHLKFEKQGNNIVLMPK
ncbi:MAG: FecR domain-containing protein [Bacteroidales bacterium]|nr:FecR domain-containing protein [Bacteroidales bacterium]